MKLLLVCGVFGLMLFTGCSQLENCPELDDLKQAGVCADPFYVDKNIKRIDAISYPKFVYVDGRYYSEEKYEEMIEEEDMKTEQNKKLKRVFDEKK
jgi:hypothetical protein